MNKVAEVFTVRMANVSRSGTCVSDVAQNVYGIYLTDLFVI